MPCVVHPRSFSQEMLKISILDMSFKITNLILLPRLPGAKELRQCFLYGEVNQGPVFCLLLGVSSDYAQPITGQVTEVTCPVIGRAQPELTPSKRRKTGHDGLHKKKLHLSERPSIFHPTFREKICFQVQEIIDNEILQKRLWWSDT